MELSDLLVETSPVEATYKGRVFKMDVFTEKLTPEYKSQLMVLVAKVEDAGDDNAEKELVDETSRMLADLISHWDVVLNGQPYAPTYENFRKLSYPLQAALLKRITTFLGELANPTNEPPSPTS